MGREWFTFSQYWNKTLLKYEPVLESGYGARNKMNSMIFHLRYPMNYKVNSKPFLYKESWSDVSNFVGEVDGYKKRSFFWRISERGLVELISVFKDLEIRSEDLNAVAKVLLNGGV